MNGSALFTLLFSNAMSESFLAPPGFVPFWDGGSVLVVPLSPSSVGEDTDTESSCWLQCWWVVLWFTEDETWFSWLGESVSLESDELTAPSSKSKCRMLSWLPVNYNNIVPQHIYQKRCHRNHKPMNRTSATRIFPNFNSHMYFRIKMFLIFMCLRKSQSVQRTCWANKKLAELIELIIDFYSVMRSINVIILYISILLVPSCHHQRNHLTQIY